MTFTDPARPQPPRYGRLDFEALWREYPPAPEFIDGVYRASRDELRAIQEKRFLQQVARAWEIPFYQSFWGKAGVQPGDIRSLDDLTKLPTFSVHDLRETLEDNPPWGGLIGIDPASHDPIPLVLQTSGGTTGLPRAMMYTPQDREVMYINASRRLYMQGVRPFDLIQVALATGLQNAGPLLRESIVGYTGAVPIMTGTGNQTPTRRQIELLKSWGVHYFAAGASYMRHVATVAREEMGIDVRDLKLKGLFCWLGSDPREPIEEMWGAKVYDNYGMNEFGTIAADCEARGGMHVFEDTIIPEIRTPSGALTERPDEQGALVVTSLFKYAAPMIRYNTNDVFSFVGGVCACGGTHRRLSQMFGRADNMVKFRGTSIFPDAIGAVAAEDARTNGEFVCVLEKPDDAGRERLIVMIESPLEAAARPDLIATLEQRFKDAVGVKLEIEVVGPGELTGLTLIDKQTKPRRLIDKTKA